MAYLQIATIPQNTITGYTLTPSSPYGTSVGIIGYLSSDAAGLNKIPATLPMTIAFADDSTSGVAKLNGTLTVNPVNGICVFNNLSVDTAGKFSLRVTDGTNTQSPGLQDFTITAVYRINPAEIIGTITATGDSNAIGPYRYRGGHNMISIRISGQSTNTTDVCKIIVVEPGQTPGTNLDEVPALVNYSASTGLVCPFSIVLDREETGGQCDIYVVGTTVTGTIKVKIQRSNG